MTSWLATVGIVISGAALGISSVSALFARRQLQLAERSRGRDFEATVVAELVEVHRADDAIRFDVQVTNAGPAVARDVDISLVEWGGTSLGTVIAEAEVAPALLRGERRAVSLDLPDASKTLDLDVSVELHTDYYDDKGVRNERLALVIDDSFVLTPPQPRSRI
jgi:hypothetical protein